MNHVMIDLETLGTDEDSTRQVSAMLWSGTRYYYTGERLTSYEPVLRKQFYNLFERV